jgi:hypothetical protein
VDLPQIGPPLFEVGKFVAEFSHRLASVGVIETVQEVVVRLAMDVPVLVHPLGLCIGGKHPIPTGVPHSLSALLDQLVQAVLDEPREVQVVFLNPLLVVVADSDVLALHRVPIHIIHMKRLRFSLACRPANEAELMENKGMAALTRRFASRSRTRASLL